MDLSIFLRSLRAIGVKSVSPSHTAFGFLFLGMRVLWHCALDARNGRHWTIWFAAGVDSFGFFRGFLRALTLGKKLHQRRFSFQFALAFDAPPQATDFIICPRVVGSPHVEFLLEERL